MRPACAHVLAQARSRACVCSDGQAGVGGDDLDGGIKIVDARLQDNSGGCGAGRSSAGSFQGAVNREERSRLGTVSLVAAICRVNVERQLGGAPVVRNYSVRGFAQVSRPARALSRWPSGLTRGRRSAPPRAPSSAPRATYRLVAFSKSERKEWIAVLGGLIAER